MWILNISQAMRMKYCNIISTFGDKNIIQLIYDYAESLISLDYDKRKFLGWFNT